MSSSSAKFLVTFANASINISNPAAFFSVPSLQEQAAVYIINNYDSVETLTADLNLYLETPVLNKMFNLLKTQLTLFQDYVVKGKVKEAEDIIKTNSKLVLPLLTYKGKVIDYSGRTIYGTALQIALGAKDVPVNLDEAMAEMLTRFLIKLSFGEDKLKKQYKEQFPEGHEWQEEIRNKNDSAALKKVFTAIKKSKNNDDCKIAIKEFHDYLKKQTEEVITTGYHFNYQLFIEAYKLYNRQYDEFNKYDNRKNILMAIKVLGSIQYYFPACLAQATCDGYENVMYGRCSLSRSDFRIPFYHQELGRSHFIRRCWGSNQDCGAISDFAGPLNMDDFDKFETRKVMWIKSERERLFTIPATGIKPSN